MKAQPDIAFIDLRTQQDRIRPRIDAAIARVLDHGQYIMGPEIGEFERQLASFCGARHAISCASGTDALLLVLMAWGVQRGDAVFVPSFTFVSTAEVIALLGATPVFLDVEPDTFLLRVEQLDAAIKAARDAGLRPRAVIPVDLFGQPADYAAVREVAAREDLLVLADAAQSFGARRDGANVGTLAPATATSFFPAKPLGCYGDGGAVFTDDDALAGIVESLRVHGKGSDKYDNVRVGINGRMDTMQAAILIEKLAIFADEVERRDRVAQRYSAALADVARVPVVAPGASCVWAQYTIQVEDRAAFAAHMKAAGVPTAVYYPTPLHRQSAFRQFPVAPGGAPDCDLLAARVISLPMHPYLAPADQDVVIAAVRAALAR
ncbi:MAG: DegT/DnrJ/EryC1/StrS aminotransferase family protein [Gammaproteobacteria bacterium]|nr:DegT/DnrJ/EryC1/StrS aminotransferase family protein [Gammaproteobacteria bacterium]